MRRVIATLRRLVVATSVGPVAWLYRGIYHLAVALALRVLRRYPAVRAVYTRHGYAHGDILPGVSDIDLIIIADGADPSHSAYERDWTRFERLVPLLETVRNHFWDVRFIHRAIAHDWMLHWNWSDAHRHWRLLHGNDLRETIPPPGGQESATGCIELGGAWMLFARRIIARDCFRKDPIILRTICCKTSAQAVKAALAFRRGVVSRSRNEALDLAGELLSAEEREFTAMTRKVAATRFLHADPELVEQTAGFLLRFVDRTLANPRPDPLFEPEQPMTLSIDAPDDELAMPARRAYAAALAEHARLLWGRSYRATYLLPAVCVAPEELILLLEIDPEHTPKVEAITALVQWHQTHAPADVGIGDLYLLMRHCAPHLGLRMHRGTCHRILTPFCHPEVFRLLGSGDCRVDGVGSPAATPEHLTRAMVEVVQTDLYRAQCELTIAGGAAAPAEMLVPLFWKILQLLILRRSMETGTLQYAFTLPAIRRAAFRMGLEVPAILAESPGDVRATVEWLEKISANPAAQAQSNRYE
jgi:hypothetical protein